MTIKIGVNHYCYWRIMHYICQTKNNNKMDLDLNLPSPTVRNGETYEYDPADYYAEMDRQIAQFHRECLREQFYKWNDIQFRQDLMTYFRRHNMNDLYLEVREDLYNG